jgi:hypothetical protein
VRVLLSKRIIARVVKEFYALHGGPLPVPFLTYKNTVRNISPDFPKIHFNIILYLLLGLRNGCFLHDFERKCCTHFSYLAHLINLYLIVLIKFSDQDFSRHFSLRGFLQPLITLSLLHRNILISALFSNTHNPCSCLNVRGQVSHPYKITGKTWFCML